MEGRDAGASQKVCAVVPVQQNRGRLYRPYRLNDGGRLWDNARRAIDCIAISVCSASSFHGTFEEDQVTGISVLAKINVSIATAIINSHHIDG